jgi:hypothetical protein
MTALTGTETMLRNIAVDHVRATLMRNGILSLGITAAITALLAVKLGAQGTPELAVGSRIRIHPPPSPHRVTPTVGHVTRLVADTLYLATESSGQVLWYHRSEIGRFDVSVGRRRHVLRGFGIGAGIGALAGVAVGYGSGNDSCTPSEREWCILVFSREHKAFIAGTAFGVVGGVVGTLIGLRPTDDWRPGAMPRISVRPTVSPGGGVGLAVAGWW